jgi:hypothetical protein
MKPARITTGEPPRRAYEEFLDFIASGTTPSSVLAFRPSESVQQRVTELIERSHDGTVSSQEQSELDDYLQLEHLMIMAKARARLKVPGA